MLVYNHSFSESLKSVFTKSDRFIFHTERKFTILVVHSLVKKTIKIFCHKNDKATKFWRGKILPYRVKLVNIISEFMSLERWEQNGYKDMKQTGYQKQFHKYLKRTLIFVAEDISQSLIQKSGTEITVGK